MRHKTLTTLAVVLVAAAVALVGCSYDEPTGPPATPPDAAPAATKAGSTVILVPDGDLTEFVGWPAIPGDPAEAWSKLDEGVANLDITDFIYTMNANHYEGLTFTDMDTTTAVDISSLSFVIPMHSSLGTALQIGFDFSYSIDGVEEGTASYDCDGSGGVPCGGDTLTFTFDDVCYTAAEINTLEMEITSTGLLWYPHASSILITAVDCEVGYDAVCEPEIENLEVLRKGNNFAVLWDTPCTASAAVDWGYADDALIYTATAGSGTDHVVNFTAADDQGCVYLQARSVGGTCSEVEETSTVQESVKDVVITNVVRTFDGLNCQFTTTWTTNVKSSSKVYWGLTPSTMTNTATGAGNTTSHSVSFDATSIPNRTRVYIKVESATDCDSAQSGTAFVVRNYCIATP